MADDTWEELRSVDGARALSSAIGTDRVRDLHKRSVLLDGLTVVWAFAEMAIALTGLAVLPYGVAWVVCAVAQPFILLHWMMVSHDLCTHRRVGGPRFAWLLSLVLSIPRFTPPTRYLHAHQLHHRYIGSELDGERYKQGLDTARSRWWLMTIVGVKTLPSSLNRVGEALPEPTPARAVRIRREVWILRAYLLVLVVGCALWPKVFLFGHLLPVLVLGPVVNTLRIVLEHSEADDSAPLFLGVRYRAGLLVGALTASNAGDGHIVHHLFPTMPWYRIPAALRLIRPHLDRAGVPERRFLPAILWAWLVRVAPHRSRWP